MEIAELKVTAGEARRGTQATRLAQNLEQLELARPKRHSGVDKLGGGCALPESGFGEACIPNSHRSGREKWG
jgi:hypothetical protein